MSRTWYLLALVPFAIGIALAVNSFMDLVGGIEDMPRMVVPGERSFELDAGEHILYGETESVVDGTAYSNPRFGLRCSLAKQDGTAIPLSRATAGRRYTLGGHAGTGMFEFELTSAGTVTLSCTTDEGKAVVAIGGSIAGAIVTGVLAAILGSLAAAAVFVIVFISRRRRRRAAGEPGTGPGAGASRG